MTESEMQCFKEIFGEFTFDMQTYSNNPEVRKNSEQNMAKHRMRGRPFTVYPKAQAGGVYYVEFRGPDGYFGHAKSTGQRTRGAAENWVMQYLSNKTWPCPRIVDQGFFDEDENYKKLREEYNKEGILENYLKHYCKIYLEKQKAEMLMKEECRHVRLETNRIYHSFKSLYGCSPSKEYIDLKRKQLSLVREIKKTKEAQRGKQ